MMFTLVFILLAGYTWSQTAGRECNDAYEFSCTRSGQCIGKLQWCDTVRDCSDGSDEYFCDGRLACIEDHHFKCNNGRCIPLSGICDNHDDCTDGSDEALCENVIPRRNQNIPIAEDVYNELESGTDLVTAKYGDDVLKAVLKATAYLIGERLSDYGWSTSTSTSRAVVALAFAEQIIPRDEYEKTLMKQQLDIQLSLNLMASKRVTSLSHLALYINALYAICQDPHNSQGMDLVSILRSQTNLAMKSTKFSLPAVLLTLCTAERTEQNDIAQLEKMSGDWGMDRLGSKALAIMAMVCNGRRGAVRGYETRVEDFFVRIGSLTANNTDVHTKALIIQAFNAVQDMQKIRRIFDYSRAVEELLAEQQEDGSFGDLLSTYYAIPALLNTSMLDVRCKHSKQNEGTLGDSFYQLTADVKKIGYSLMMPSDTEDNIHSTVISFSGNKTFYDVMKIAKARDPMFRFSTDHTKEGRKVYSLAGIPNDAQTGMTWTLYTASSSLDLISSKNSLFKIETGVDRTFPREEDQYVFWLKRN